MSHRVDRLVACGLTLALLAGCGAGPQTRRQGVIGAGVGAAAGAIIGNNVKGVNSAEGAIAGAILGGLAGGARGQTHDRMDAQQAQLNQMRYEMNSRTIMITNSNGSQTPVVVTKISPTQWRGPRGEIYNGLPSPQQLQRVYGF